MELKFLGASGTVTGSSYLLTANKTKVLIDFGMFQGTSAEEELNFRPFSFNPKEVDALFLTHAHLDHCGRLPLLVKNGFSGPIFATTATRELAEIVMFDSAKIAEYENFYEPMYTDSDVVDTLALFKLVSFHEQVVFRNLLVEYFNAGHILGAASIKFTNKTSGKSVIFSGDIGSYPDPLVPYTEFIDSADWVVMESTYGGKIHPTSDPVTEFARFLVEADRGKRTLLIPAFAIQKTQVLLEMISALKRQGVVSADLPVYLDSPMAFDVTKIYIDHKDEISTSNFSFPGLVFTAKGGQSKKIHKQKGAKVIIAGSGMMNGGRILSHAKKYLNQKRTMLLFVGYQAEETLGREIKEGAERVFIDGKEIFVNAQIDAIETLSSHADQPRLINWLKQIKNVEEVFLTHGEDEARIPLALNIRRETEVGEVNLPVLDEEVVLVE